VGVGSPCFCLVVCFGFLGGGASLVVGLGSRSNPVSSFLVFLLVLGLTGTVFVLVLVLLGGPVVLAF
jgi:hypothetical protein